MYCLRELERKDMARINGWKNDPQVIALLDAPFCYINADVDEAWFDNYMRNRGNAIRCAIIHEKTDELIGLVSLTNIDYINQSAELHIMIGNQQNSDAAIFAVRDMLEHAFYNMNMHRIELTVLVSNQRAQHVYEEYGFKREGILRQAYFKQGKFEDVYQYAVLREEYSTTRGDCSPREQLPSFCIMTLPSGRERKNIIQQFEHLFPYPLTKRPDFSDTLRKINEHAVFGVAYSEEILGYVAFYCNDQKQKIAFLSLIAVNKNCQHQHVGTKLLQMVEEISLQHGMRFLKLEVSEENSVAISFYQNSGFEMRGKCSENSFFMIKKLV